MEEFHVGSGQSRIRNLDEEGPPFTHAVCFINHSLPSGTILALVLYNDLSFFFLFQIGYSPDRFMTPIEHVHDVEVVGPIGTVISCLHLDGRKSSGPPQTYMAMSWYTSVFNLHTAVSYIPVIDYNITHCHHSSSAFSVDERMGIEDDLDRNPCI
jgi:hypothetical protein